MKPLTNDEMFPLLCKALGKFGLYVSFELDNVLEIYKAAPYLDAEECFKIVLDGGGVLMFDTEEEMREKFDLTVGDDGPTKTNPYSGKCRVYALTCDDQGNLLSENT